MARRKPQRPPTWQDLTGWWAELQESVSLELIGLIFFLVGGFLLLTLLPGGDGFPQSLPWLTGMVGWTAPMMALALLITGAVLMLGERAGYWSVEAMVGAELLLLALQMGTFLWQHSEPDWAPQIDGASGGLVGATLGSLLLAGFGRWPAFVILLLMGGVGLYFLGRYTPLAYITGQGIPVPSPLQALRTRWVQPGEQPAPPPTGSLRRPASTNFVPPHDPQPAADTPVIARKPGRKAKTTTPPVEEDRQQNGNQPSPTNGAASAKPAERKAKARAVTAEATAMRTVATSGHLPTLDLLTADDASPQRVDVEALQGLIEGTLADFNVPVRTVHVESGPTVTQFGVEPLYLERAGQRRKVRVSRIVNLADDLALALAVPAVRIEAPVPGRPYVGIEVPNADKQRVRLRGIMESKAMTQGGTLALPLGRNTAGAPVVMDLARAPHMLIAGATGAGKSVCINTIISGLLMQHGPERLRFVMVDPKMVELPGYNGIPHLIGNVITDVEQVMGALTWLLLQMDDRYRLFQQAGVRNLESYNGLAQKGKKSTEGVQPLPYIVLIIDELADLMMTAAEDIERQICRLAQMARATGIHLILATQRPSVDVVTGLIKANFPTRIAFAVTSQTDSRVILDTPGAERLLGRGDMLLMRPDVAKLWRVQGCFVSDEEITQVVSFWKAQSPPPAQATPSPWAALMDRLDDEEELVQDAIDAVQGLTQISTSQLQRKLRIGYPKAAALMEKLEARGIIGPDRGAGQGREVLRKDKEEGSDGEEDETLFEQRQEDALAE